MNKPGFLYRFLGVFVKTFTKTPTIINLNDELSAQAIYISNHSAASGPFKLSIYFPMMFRPWGIYRMCFGFRDRWKYLYHVFYQQKQGFSKFKAFILASLMGLVTGLGYKSMKVIPSYEDGRLINTIKTSLDHLETKASVFIFPEDSSKGYFDVLTYYHPGFVFLAEQFYKKHQIDLPIYSVYYDKKINAFIIDKPDFIQPNLKKGHSREEVAQKFRDRANELRDVLHDKVRQLRGKI